MTTHDVAQKLYELCNAGQWDDALKQLYADDARHVEAMAMPGMDGPITQGKDKLMAMSEAWKRTTTVHGQELGKPLVNGDQFVITMALDATSSEGPMAGKRHTMSETCLYTVADGKIVEAKFFYSM